jgi:hypothetical protein
LPVLREVGVESLADIRYLDEVRLALLFSFHAAERGLRARNTC